MKRITPPPSYLRISTTNNKSTVFATKDIPKGTVVCITDITNVNYHEGCIMSPRGDVFLHSERYANTEIQAKDINTNSKDRYKIKIVTSRKIESGEELLINYPNLAGQYPSRNELIKILRSKGESIPGTKYEEL